MSIKRILLVGASVVAFAGAAQAGHNTGWYIGGEGGVNWVDDTTFTESGPAPTYSPDIEFDEGWGVFGTAGYKWDSGLRLEGELGWRENDGDGLGTIAAPGLLGFGAGPVLGEVDLTQLSIFANLLYDIPLGDTFTFSIGGGIGIIRADVEGFAPVPGLFFVEDTDTFFAYQGLAQLAFKVTDHMDLTLGYRYTAGDAEFNSAPALIGTIYDADIENHTLTAGLRYYFGTPAAPMIDTPPPVETPMAKTYIVFFDFNKANLTSEAQAVVAEAAAAFNAGANVVLIVGHTDTVGSARYNQKLSERRAANVKAEMVRLGVPSDVITTEGRGFSDPMVPTGPGVREPQNRRAVIELQ